MAVMRRLPPVAGGPRQGMSEVTRGWAGHTVVCIASGPSLTLEQVNRTKAARDREGRPVAVAAINDNYRVAPWADLLYFADRRWFEWHRDLPAFKAFAGEKVSLHLGGAGYDDAPEIHTLRVLDNHGLSTEPGALCTGSNSGHQLINLAVLAGAARILLLGYDAGRGPQQQKHHAAVGKNGEHPNNTEPPYQLMRRTMQTIPPAARALGVDIINCSPGSAIECFARGSIEDYLDADASALPDPAAAVVSARSLHGGVETVRA